MAKRSDRTKEQILAAGLEVAQEILRAQGVDQFEDIGAHLRCRTPWRNDKTPSLDLLKAPDGRTPAGSWIDRGTSEKGDVFALAARCWGLDCKTDFREILQRCAKIAGIALPEPRPEVPVEQRAGGPEVLEALAASYGLTAADFFKAKAKLSAAWFPDLGQQPGKDIPGHQAPAVIYPADGPGGKVAKNKTLFRYLRTETGFTIAAPPAGKRHSSGKGHGFFAVAGNPTGPVVYTGGEEKALAAGKAGFQAVSYTHGEKAPQPDEAVWLREKLGDREIIVAMDNDVAGREATQAAAQRLAAAGFLRLRSVCWPATAPERADLADTLREGGIEALRAFLAAAAPIQGAVPQVIVTDRQLRDQVDDAWRIVLARNDPPVLFQRSGQLVTREAKVTRGGRIFEIEPISAPRLREMLSRLADWCSLSPKGELRAARIPVDVVDVMIAKPHADIPRLEAVLTSPAYGASGTLLARTGYHASDHVWMEHDLALPEIPAAPSRDELHAARDLLLEVFCDFPVAGDADRAHLLAMVLLPFTRLLISGPTPLHLVTSPTPGTGKSLLAGVVAMLATGRISEARQFSEREEERQKMLFSELVKGANVLLLDNISQRRELDSGTLASYLTSPLICDRLLGQTRQAVAANLATWILTGNNVQLSGELTRRAVQIRLDAKQDRPWERTAFKHKHLTAYVLQNRPQLVAAALTLVQGWIAVGSPPGDIHLGSFEEWARVIGGILKVAGVTAALTNLEDLYERSDSEGTMWRAFTEAWWERYYSVPVKPSELAELADQRDLLTRVLGDGNEKSRASRMGRELRKVRDRVFNDLRVDVVFDRKGPQYRLDPVEGSPRAAGCQTSAGLCRTIEAEVRHIQTQQNQTSAGLAGLAGHIGGHTHAHTGARAGARARMEEDHGKSPASPASPASASRSFGYVAGLAPGDVRRSPAEVPQGRVVGFIEEVDL